MSYNSELQNNNAELQEILDEVNNLPEAGGGESVTDAVRYTAQDLTNGQKAQARENIGAVAKSGISLGVHSDGLIYVFVDGSPVGDGIELATAGDVIGYVDENNNVILTGALADGTYNIKYEMEDGSTVDIGDLVLDTNVYYSVTNTLTNCVSNNGTTEVIEGEGYSATITANEGYELSSVVVTMGGSPVSVTDGVINIASVTGVIVITAVAEEKQAAEPVTETITLLKETSLKGANFDEDRTGTTGYCATPSIDLANIPKPCVINLTGARWAYADNTSTGYVRLSIFDKNGTKLVSGYTWPSAMPSGVTMTVNNGDESDVTVTVTSDDIGKLRFAGYWAWNNIEENLNGTVMVAKATLTYTPNS